MFVPLVATRYLFAKKRHNTINLITWVSMAGVAVGTVALICVLSVMNGFERVISDSMSAFDPEIRITASTGNRVLTSDSAMAEARKALPGSVWSYVVELDGLIATDESQSPVKVLGVDEEFSAVTGIDTLVWSGRFEPAYDGAGEIRAAVGVGLATRMHCTADGYSGLSLYAPKSRKVNMARPDANFTKTRFVCNGLFCVQQPKYDDNYIIMPIEAVREAYRLEVDYASAVEIRLSRRGAVGKGEVREAKRVLEEVLGEGYTVADRREQQADFYRISRIEKWTSFMILCFIILVATFNIVGSLSMIIIDKADDIDLMLSIGASRKAVMRLFTAEGGLISGLGCAIGAAAGIVLVMVQERFGVLKLGSGGYITNVYPVELIWWDVVLTVVAVLGMGLAAAAYAARSNIRNIKDI